MHVFFIILIKGFLNEFRKKCEISSLIIPAIALLGSSIVLHLIGITDAPRTEAIYENHAGCERGYFYTPDRKAIALPKKDKNGVNLYLPDLILKNDENKEILLIEGKQSSTLNQGLEEIKHFESIEDEFIKKYYPSYSITRWVSTFGENIYQNGLNPKVLFHLNKNGTYLLNDNAPKWLVDLFKRVINH